MDHAAAAVAQRMGLAGDEADRLRDSARHMIAKLVGLGLLALAEP